MEHRLEHICMQVRKGTLGAGVAVLLLLDRKPSRPPALEAAIILSEQHGKQCLAEGLIQPFWRMLGMRL